MSIYINNETQLSPARLNPKYFPSYGAALAMIEAAQNEHAMFQACVALDMREMQLNESASVVALQEAGIGGIWENIKKLFTKFKEKVKSIFHVFMSKFNALTKSNKEYAKKYGKELRRKENIDNLTVKWSDDIENNLRIIEAHMTLNTGVFDAIKKHAESVTGWKDKDSEDKDNDIVNLIYTGEKINNRDDIKDLLDIDISDEQIKDIGQMNNSILRFISELETSDKELKTFDRDLRKIIKECESAEKSADREAKTAAGDKALNGTGDTQTEAKNKLDAANIVYDMCVRFTSIVTEAMNVNKSLIVKKYSLIKAAVVKAVAANSKKLEENAVLLDAIAEASEAEVDGILDDVKASDVFPDNWETGDQNLLSGVKGDRLSRDFGHDNEPYKRYEGRNSKISGTVGMNAYGDDFSNEAASIFGNLSFI